jgi:hypothetical protein
VPSQLVRALEDSFQIPLGISVMYRVPGLGLPESRYTGHSGCPVVPGHPVYSVVRRYVRTRMSLSLCAVYLLERQTDTETEQQKDRRQTHRRWHMAGGR